MGKAMIIFDMPYRCFDCPLLDYEVSDDMENYYVCKRESFREPVTRIPMILKEIMTTKPKWCPLIPVKSIREDGIEI